MPGARRINAPITFVVGLALIAMGACVIVGARTSGGLVPLIIGCSLAYMAWRGGRAATIIFGHALVVMGSYMLTWGIYLLPYSKPIPSHIFGRPLFWGFITLFGGICAIYHGFCNCVVMRSPARQARPESS